MKRIRDIEYCHTYERKNDETIYYGYKIDVEDTSNSDNSEIVQIFIEKDNYCCENYGIIFYTFNTSDGGTKEIESRYIEQDMEYTDGDSHSSYTNIESFKNM